MPQILANWVSLGTELYLTSSRFGDDRLFFLFHISRHLRAWYFVQVDSFLVFDAGLDSGLYLCGCGAGPCLCFGFFGGFSGDAFWNHVHLCHSLHLPTDFSTLMIFATRLSCSTVFYWSYAYFPYGLCLHHAYHLSSSTCLRLL